MMFRSPGIRLFAGIAILFCAILFLGAFVTDRSEVITKRVNIAVRAIGHELLNRAGDFTSVVPPVIEKSRGVFMLEFENEFAFQPDTLVAIVQRSLVKTGLSQYTVTVQECNKPYIVYGFEIIPPNNITVPCRGRTHPKACYKIEIAFEGFPKSGVQSNLTSIAIIGVLSALGLVLIGRNFGSKNATAPVEQNPSIQTNSNPVLTIGKFTFDSTHQRLRKDGETISLTDKECKILMLLNRNIGQLTLRDELVQEVWTEEGVITGRSLDMFISKLRKKLSLDPDLRITNIHGKGYRLEILDDAVGS